VEIDLQGWCAFSILRSGTSQRSATAM
jgi:hypothetical protein